MSLLAAGDKCDQQNAADAMIDLAKQLNNDAEMIRLAQIFVQQPRNAPDSLQVPYCQKAPKNAELNGLFHCQFAGSKFPTFSGDQTGNLPLGVTAVNPAGSCPAKTDGPVPDGEQLATLVKDPGVPSASGDSGNNTTTGSDNDSGSDDNSTDDGDDDEDSGATGGDSGDDDTDSCSDGGSVSSSTPASPSGSTSVPADNKGSGSNNSGSSFKLTNGQDAQKLNAQFATLSATGSCTEGDQACVSGGFAQCVGGKFVIAQCSGGTQCFALPLVNKAGTSLSCTTQADAQSRIEATGATGGITGA